MTEPNGGGEVRYTVKEMFAEIQTQLKTIDDKLDTKADKSLLVGMEHRLSRLELEGSRTAQVTEQNLYTFRQDASSRLAQVEANLGSEDAVSRARRELQQASVSRKQWIVGIVATVLLWSASIVTTLLVHG